MTDVIDVATPDVIEEEVKTIDGIVTNVHWMNDRVVLEVEFGPTERTVTMLGLEQLVQVVGKAIVADGKLNLNAIPGIWISFKVNDNGSVAPLEAYAKPFGLYDFLALQTVQTEVPAEVEVV